MISIVDKHLSQSAVIKTGVDYLDAAGVRYGGMTVISGIAGVGKTTAALQVAINLGVNGDKKVLYLMSPGSAYSTPLQFLRMVTDIQGNEMCHNMLKKHQINEVDIGIADEVFDPTSTITVATVARVLDEENSNVKFMSFDCCDFGYIERELEENDYDIVVVDAAYSLHEDKNQKLSSQAFCTSLCNAKLNHALIVTAPIAYKDINDKSKMSKEDLIANDAGLLLYDNADAVIALVPYFMHEGDDSKRVEFLKSPQE